MSFYSLGIMKNRRCQMTIFYIHVFKSESIFFFQKLIEKYFFQINSFNIEHSHQAFKIASIANHMISVSTFIININFLMNNLLWTSHLCYQIKYNILESQIAKQNKVIMKIICIKYLAISIGLLPASSLSIKSCKISFQL